MNTDTVRWSWGATSPNGRRAHDRWPSSGREEPRVPAGKFEFTRAANRATDLGEMNISHPPVPCVTFTFLSPVEVWKLQAVSKEYQRASRSFLSNQRTVLLRNVCFASEVVVARTLRRLTGAGDSENSKLEQLIVINARVTLGSGALKSYACNSFRISSLDHRSFTAALPLSVFGAWPGLRRLVWESQSEYSQPPASQDDIALHASSSSLQLGLANMEEIADLDRPMLQEIWCLHVEREAATRRVTDVWGPDVTPAFIRRLRMKCPMLRSLGVLSSPGPRIVDELRRRYPEHTSATAIVNRADVQETFRVSLLDTFASAPWRVLERVAISITSGYAPYASGRAAVYSFREQRGNDNSGWAELEDVLSFASKHAPIGVAKYDLYIRNLATRLAPELNEADLESRYLTQLYTGLNTHHYVLGAPRYLSQSMTWTHTQSTDIIRVHGIPKAEDSLGESLGSIFASGKACLEDLSDPVETPRLTSRARESFNLPLEPSELAPPVATTAYAIGFGEGDSQEAEGEDGGEIAVDWDEGSVVEDVEQVEENVQDIPTPPNIHG